MNVDEGSGLVGRERARSSCCANGTPARFHGQRGGRRRHGRVGERERELGEEERSVVGGRREELDVQFIEDERERERRRDIHGHQWRRF
jgi:hypothetical protein